MNKTEVRPKQLGISWLESYTSLLLGLVVVIVAAILLISFAKNRNIKQTSSTQYKPTNVAQENKSKNPKEGNMQKTYIVKSGDSLWSISEELYKSGYNWVDIAKANKLENPSLVYAQDKLTIPDAKTKEITVPIQSQLTGEQKLEPIKGISYSIVQGDNLWNISVRAYGDGYRFVELTKTNNISDPNLIFSGNVLKIPR